VSIKNESVWKLSILAKEIQINVCYTLLTIAGRNGMRIVSVKRQMEDFLFQEINK